MGPGFRRFVGTRDKNPNFRKNEKENLRLFFRNLRNLKHVDLH